MSMKEKRVKNVVESDDDNEPGACGTTTSSSNDPRRPSLAVPEAFLGGLLDDSVDNLSMEVHLGEDNSRHPSEISSISYQNLLDDGEPSNSIISRRGSDDSLDSYPPDFPDAELPPDEMETFEASDLPLSEHFPMGALQGADSKDKARGDRSSYVSDNSSNFSRPNVKLKDVSSDLTENVKMRDKNVSQNVSESNLETESNAKRNSLEIRNNIPVVGEVKDYEKELNIDFNKIQGPKPKMSGIKQSPGVARRVDIDLHGERDGSSAEQNPEKQCETSVSSVSTQQPHKLKPKSTNVIEVISPIPKNINIENEYDYVKYARVQQGNSYVGMRLAYSSSNDSLNIKQGVGSDSSSREPSPEKSLQQKILSELGSQEKVSEETLTEIPLNNSDYCEDKKAFTLSPENTECDSVEVESVTSEGENSTPGFPTVEDGLSSSQASDVEEEASGIGADRSPSKMLKAKQKAAIDQDLMKEDEDTRPKEMDAQAIMDDLKMKREALDMAIADIKSAIQRSKSMSLESPYPSQQEGEEAQQPVWVKRENREAANQLQRRQEEMRKVREEIERQQEQMAPIQGKTPQEKATDEAQYNVTVLEQLSSTDSGDAQETNSSTYQTLGNGLLENVNNGFSTQSEDVTSTFVQGLDTATCVSEPIPDELKTEDNLETVYHGKDNVMGKPIVLSASGKEENEAEQALVRELHQVSPDPEIDTNMDYELEVTTSVPLSVAELSSSEQSPPDIEIFAARENMLQTRTGDQNNLSDSLEVNSEDLISHLNSDPLIDSSLSKVDDENSSCDEEIQQKSNVKRVTTKEHSEQMVAYLSDVSDVKRQEIYASEEMAIRSLKEIKTNTFLNSAIAAVSNDFILSLGSTSMKTTVIENKTAEIVKEDVKIPAVSQQQTRFDIEEFDNLAQTLPVEAEEDKHDLQSYPMETPDEDVTQSKYIGNLEKVETSPVVEQELNNEDDGSEEDEEFYDASDNEEPDDADAVVINRETDHVPEDADGLVGNARPDGLPRGYDSDDECEDAEGIRYTRRNKGKKYAPLQKDDSLEMSGAYGGGSMSNAAKPNGHMFSNNHGSHSGSNGTVANHLKGLQSGEHHIHRAEPPLSSEESSDIDANISSYARPPNADSDTDEETDRLLHKQYQERDKHVEIPELSDPSGAARRSESERSQSKAKEAAIRDPDRPEVLIEGVLFRARYLGSTQLISEGQPSKAMRMMQAQEAVGRIKAPEGEHQPSTDVDLFVSTEKIMVLNTDLQEIMMDHSLRTISYIADIGDILVIMARRRLITSPDDVLGRRRRQAKILCHVFESDEAQLIAQSIGQAFQVAYLEFLKANGIEDPGLLKEMDYQDVLNQQEIYGEELNLFANKDFHKEVIVPKSKNEPLGVVIVESGWGSMVPTVVLANMLPTGPAARCGQLNIGDQIISINGISLVGLPLSACQTYIKASRSQTVVKLTVVPCPPVVEVLIKRPDVKYQLGFSVQNGVICSLLRGGIAERGGVRVGHRIIEINNQSVVAVPHEKIVTLLASSVGEIHMKTMPTSIFRLLTGQDVPHYL